MKKDDDLRKYFLSKYKHLKDIAILLNCTDSAISQMFKRGVSAETALKLEKLSCGKIKAKELRPDLF